MTENPATGRLLHRSAVVCAELLVVAAALWVLARVLATLAVVVIPVALALLLAALLAPAVTWLARHHVPRALATAVVLVGGVAAVGAVLWFVVKTVVDSLPDLRTQLGGSYQELRGWLGSVGVRPEQLDQVATQAREWVAANQQSLATGAWNAFATLGSVLTGLALAIFVLVFVLYDGERIWRFLSLPFRGSARRRVDAAGKRAFHDLTAFMFALIIVSAVDAVGIGIGLWVTGVPLVVPLATLVFLGGFVPMIGAFVTGLLAALVALVAEGPFTALLVVLIVIAVQQLEGNVLEPMITSRAVRLHPVAVILAIAVGVQQAGVIGALLAVPALSTIRAITATLLETEQAPGPAC
ncbi:MULTISPECIES: AI-2E family transporter [Amycolatopsis]|uniref:Putative PurR-regulated permease PerM n=1 Tax=Amycolatopsis thermoflava TaxID=84480 RepID=A0A3N2H2Z9_9PSEU|nr:AI-2E family transporter [Amycolatopsis thermoflava]ROS43298.1 putative PurR-regulated permease PerM [Amycolatopsis thermoflava]